LIFYTFANENLSLQDLAVRLNRLHIPTPRGGDRWRASTLGIMLRNEVYIGKMYQFRKYHIEPKFRRKPSAKSKRTSTALHPREEWIPVKVPSLIQIELFETVQRKLKANEEFSKRNAKREYLLSGLLYCAQCGGRMGGHTIHSIPYYRCYRKGNPDRVPLSSDGKPIPCSYPEIKTEAIEPVVWDTICELVKNPDFLIQELRRRSADSSQTKEILERELQLCEARLKAIPEEQKRLVEGYCKGLYADFMMREEMELIQKEQGALEKRKAELERQLAQRLLTQNGEGQIRSLMEKISIGLDNLDFTSKQELLRLLVEKVFYNGQSVEILTIIPLGGQLHPIHRGG
jgi:site-specific DNA recombinase